MKMNKLQELNSKELKDVNGGWWGVAVNVALWVVSEWDCLVEGYNEARK